MEPTLTELVVRLADAPTPSNQALFYRKFTASRVSFKPGKVPENMTEGAYVTREGDCVSIATTTAPNGETMLLVFTDRDSILALQPGGPFAEMDGRDVLQICLANRFGVIVQCVHNGKPSWAGIAAAHVVRLLNNPAMS